MENGYLFEELFFSNNKQKKINEMIGNNKLALDYNSDDKNLNLLIPIPFFYDDIGIPLVNLENTNIYLIFDINDKNTLINKQEFFFNENNNINNNPNINNNKYSVDLKLSNCCLLADHFIDHNEKIKIFNNFNYDLLINNHRFEEKYIDFNSKYIKKNFFKTSY